MLEKSEITKEKLKEKKEEGNPEKKTQEIMKRIGRKDKEERKKKIEDENWNLNIMSFIKT